MVENNTIFKGQDLYKAPIDCIQYVAPRLLTQKMLNSAVPYPEVVSKNVGTVSVGEDGRSIYYNELLLDNMRMSPLGLVPRKKLE